MAEFSFTPDIETPDFDSSEFSFTPDETQETANINIDNYNGMDLVGDPGEDAKPYSKMDLFLKNLFTFDVKSGEEVAEKQKNNPRVQALEKVKTDGLDDVKWGEVGKSLTKSFLELGKSMTASPLKIYGDWSMDERDTSLMTPEEANEVKFNNFRAQSFVKVGDYIEQLWNMGINADWLKEDEETFKGTFVENPSMTRVLSLGASAIPSITAFGLTSKITGSRKLASILLAGADNDDLYFEAREAGEDKNKALALYAAGTAGTAALEKYGFDQIFNKRVTAPFAKRVVNAALSEGFTETFQAGYQNAIKRFGYDDTQDLLEGVVESFIAGALSGGAISAADAGYIKLQNARNKLKDKGATDEALDNMQEEFARELSHHRKTVEPMFQTKITESLNNLDKFIKENKDEALVAQALEKKKQLETIYNNTYNELKNIMPEQEAKSNAALVRNSAFFFAEEFGISPEEFVKQRGVKVQKSDYNQFAGNVATSTTEDMPIMQVTQREINYAKAHPEWKSNARIIEMIGQAGADINDSLGNINKALKEYSIKENQHIKEMEIAEFDRKAKDLSEDLQERYAMMVENGVKPQDAYNAVTYTEDYIPFQGGETKLNMSSALPKEIADRELNIVELDNVEALDEKTLKQNIQNLIDKQTTETTSDGALLSFVNKVWDDIKGYPVAKHIAYSSKTDKGDVRKKSINNILDLIKSSAFVEAGDETKGKKGYNKVLRFYVPVRVGNDVFPVRIVALHKEGSDTVNLTGDVYDVIMEKTTNEKENQVAATSRMEEPSRSRAERPDTIKISHLLENVKGIDKTLYRESYNPREDIPNVRGGWTKNKILKYLKANGSLRGVGTATRMIAEFDSVEEFKEHMFYHGAKYGTSGRMKPSITMSDREVENVGGGGYGDKYWAISLSKSKKVAGNFATASGNGSIYPVLLVKNAKVIEMPELDDSADLEDHIEQLYNDGVDAVWIGDKDSGEQELAVINPKAIVNIGTSEFYRAYKLGQPENPINIRSDEEIQKIYDYAKGFVREYPKTAPDEEIGRARNIVYWQSAFHGTPHPELEGGSFKLEKIGTGENAQAHGYGLYYTASYDVADKRYRERLTKPYTWFISFGEVEFDKKTGKYKNAFNETTLEFEVYKDFKLDAGEDIDVLLKSYEQTRFLDNRTDEKIAIVNKYKDYFVNDDIHNFSDESMATGQVYEVDLPENPYLLDEQKKFSEQSDYVQEKLLEVFRSLSPEQAKKITGDEKTPVENMLRWQIGRDIYKNLATGMGSQKATSQLLEKYGIKGITYEGREDGRCFVIFNPDDVKVIQKFYQDGANDPKGAYVNRIIHLFQNADASTLPHELAHFWKDTLKDAAKMSKRAAKMLEDVERWAEQEFNRKYSVQLKDGRYVVNNKQGLTVYDHNFRTEADAKEYAKEELFAQGNETYLKEGVAPNNSLKQAFRNFLNWLKHIYNQARQLDIRLSPEIRQVYADILGGTEIDFFLNTDPDTFIENRIKLANETKMDLDEQIAEAQRMGVKVSDPDGRKLKDVWEKAMIPLSTRLGRISKELKNRLRRYEFDVTNTLNKYYDEARPFLQKWKNFSEMDTIAFDIALKNDYVEKQLQIVDKYGAREEWEKVRKLLLDIYDSAIKAGLDVNFRPDYFPRKVKDAKGLLAYLRGTEEWTKFQEALREADPENIFTEEEQADFLNKYLRGFIKVDMMPYKYSSEKQRKIERINNEMNKYYAPSMESLVNYIEGMNARIKASEFLGRDAENLEESVGGYLTYLLNNNKIDPTKVDEVREILQARFAQKGVGNRFVAGMRDLSYMYTMGGINSAITQIEDLSVSMYKAGIWNTLTTAFENKKIKRADLGLDKISAEFVENPSKTARGVEKLFKLTGLDKIDSFGKETLVNAMVKKFQKMSEKSLKEYLEPIMEQETNQTIQDIKNGELSDNVLYLVFSELSDVQPISLSELPAFYNTSGNLRVLYMLKSFMVKRIDIFRNECFDKLRSGNKEARIQGIQNLFRLAILMIFCGASKDLIINMLYGRDIDLPEMLINNALGLVGFSKFHAYQLRDKGAGEVIKDFLMPPMFAPYDDLLGDVVRIGRGKRDLKDAETLKGIPLVGRFYYWHIGRGKEKMNKRKNKLK